mgnify:FL=1
MRREDTELREKILRKLRIRGIPRAGQIADYCMRLKKAVNPLTVILHGSMAKGQQGVWSDVDIIVVAEFEESFLDRISTLIELIEGEAPIEPLGYTPQEFMNMIENCNPTALEAMEYGLPLLGEEAFEEMKKRFEEVKAKLGLRRIKTGWTTNLRA